MHLARCLALVCGLALVVTNAAAQELKIGLAAEPSAMDPHYHNLSPNNSILSHVFERLIEPDEKQRLTPGLAESWKVIDDTVWEFKLRKGVTWHDGSPFTADDVIFTFQRAPNVPNSPSSFAAAVKGKTIKKIDDYTVHISAGSVSPTLPNELAGLLIVSKKHGEGARTEDYNSGKAAIGTGPFKLVKFTPSDRIEFERYDGYWGPKPRWTKVTFRPISAGPARVAALLAGDVDLIEDTPTADIERLKKDPKIEVSQGVSNRLVYFFIDHARDVTPFAKAKDGSEIKNPFKDKRVRQAMNKAVNRDAIVSRVMEGVAIPASQFLPDGYFGVSDKLKPVAYDPEGAKKLLTEAGFPNGFKLTLHTPTGATPTTSRSPRPWRRCSPASASRRRSRRCSRRCSSRAPLRADPTTRPSSASSWSAGRRRRARTRAPWCRWSTRSTGPRAPARPTAAATPMPRWTGFPPRRSRSTTTPSGPHCWPKPPRSR